MRCEEDEDDSTHARSKKINPSSMMFGQKVTPSGVHKCMWEEERGSCSLFPHARGPLIKKRGLC